MARRRRGLPFTRLLRTDSKDTVRSTRVVVLHGSSPTWHFQCVHPASRRAVQRLSFSRSSSHRSRLCGTTCRRPSLRWVHGSVPPRSRESSARGAHSPFPETRS
jgi:hypothetical protein